MEFVGLLWVEIRVANLWKVGNPVEKLNLLQDSKAMQNEIYKITLTDLSKFAHLADFIEYQSAVDKIRNYLKSDLEEEAYKQNHQNIKFVVSIANSIYLQENETVQNSMKYFLNIFIEKHYSYDMEYDWQQLKPILFLANYLETATDFKSFEKQTLNPHLHSLLLKYLSE